MTQSTRTCSDTPRPWASYGARPDARCALPRQNSSGQGVGYNLTLIEAEVLDELTLADGRRLEYAEARRNITTRGIDLNALVGERFTVGEVECIGRRCEPCSHLERLTHAGVLRGLIHRGGLRVDILSEGTIQVGAMVQPVVRR